MTWSFIRRIERQPIVDAVPERWRKQYRGYYEKDKEKMRIADALDALPRPLKREDVNSTIGNNSWTALSCDNCGRDDDDFIYRLGDKPDYDKQWIDLCPKCVADLPRLVQDAPISVEDN